ncbi:hypothetical protein [Shewanella sp. SR44-3]|uniref:hypothetical protein n=1 Tax=unclassified Shewanella TaxID=196818 RepID=UPI0015F8394C|nr:hypothetical protein [Shewanella sp. SR44-3]MBB1267797.1 hypothetical protein [Shewanella sp. SR44-3]
MIRFQYDFFPDQVELQASNWSGIERLLLNGKSVSSKINFGANSTHYVELKDGKPCKFRLQLDPQTDQLTCQVFKQNQLIASLKQGKQHLSLSRHNVDLAVLFSCCAILAILLL